MNIAVASGKGGTGKTTLAVSLAIHAARDGVSVAYVDCDVEAPNGHLFLAPEVTSVAAVEVRVPQVDDDRCTHCGLCAEVCRFQALAVTGNTVLTFPELCHSCGGCARFCPQSAIEETPRRIGEVRSGRCSDLEPVLKGIASPARGVPALSATFDAFRPDTMRRASHWPGKPPNLIRTSLARGRETFQDRLDLDFVGGLLGVGEVLTPAVIEATRDACPPGISHAVIDSPPGTSCAAVAAVRGCDAAILVSDPTPFGLHDLTLAVEMVRVLGVPCGVVINRCTEGANRTRDFCQREGLPVVGEIPDDPDVARTVSSGAIVLDRHPAFAAAVASVWEEVRHGMAGHGAEGVSHA